MIKNKTICLISVLIIVFGLQFFVSAAQETSHLLVISTGGTGGAYYPYGGAIAKVVQEKFPELNITVQTSAGAVENVRLLYHNEVELGMAAADVSYAAYNGFEPFDSKFEGLRALFAMAPSTGKLIVLKDSDIYAYEDIKGKRVALGPPGSGTEVKAKRLLEEVYGIKYEDFTPAFISFAEASAAMIEGSIDASFVDAFVPTAAVIQLATSRPIRIIPISDDMLNKMTEKFPYHSKLVLSKGTYDGIDQDIDTFGTWCHVLVREDFDEEVAYKIVKAVYDDPSELISIVSIAHYTTLENATTGMLVPLHPGAERYFKEVGIK